MSLNAASVWIRIVQRQQRIVSLLHPGYFILNQGLHFLLVDSLPRGSKGQTINYMWFIKVSYRSYSICIFSSGSRRHVGVLQECYICVYPIQICV